MTPEDIKSKLYWEDNYCHYYISNYSSEADDWHVSVYNCESFWISSAYMSSQEISDKIVNGEFYNVKQK